MIEKFYAAHIKNTLDASQINVMRTRRRRERQEAPTRRKILRERGQATTARKRSPVRRVHSDRHRLTEHLAALIFVRYPIVTRQPVGSDEALTFNQAHSGFVCWINSVPRPWTLDL